MLNSIRKINEPFFSPIYSIALNPLFHITYWCVLLYLGYKCISFNVMAIVIDIISAYLLADFLSGLAHLLSDVYFRDNFIRFPERNKQLNESLHHLDILDTGNCSAYELVSFEMLGAFILLPLSIIFYFLGLYRIVSILMITNIFLLHSEYFHHNAHIRNRVRKAEDMPYLIRKLQDFRLLVTAYTHFKHHQKTTVNFAVISGWTNVLLNMYVKLTRIQNPQPKLLPVDYNDIRLASPGIFTFWRRYFYELVTFKNKFDGTNLWPTFINRS